MKASPLVQHMLGEATMKYANREFQKAIGLLLEIVRIAPGLPHAYHTLGLIYEERGQASKALKLFLMAAHLSKRNAHAWKSLAALCRSYGEREQCIYCLQRALAISPDDVECQWDRAQLLSELGEHRKSAKALLPLLRQQPENADMVHSLVRSYHRLGHPAKAIALLDGLITGSERTKLPPTGGGTHARASGGRDGDGDEGDVISSNGNGVDRSGVEGGRAVRIDFHSLNMLLELLIEAGKFAEALSRVETCRRMALGLSGAGVAPSGADATSGAAGASGGGGADTDGARSTSDRASGGWGFPLDIRVKEGVCHAFLGDLAAAEACWQPLFSRANAAGDCADLVYEVALCYFALRLWEKALPLLQQMAANPLYTTATGMRIGECLGALGRGGDSAEAFTLAFDNDPTSLSTTLTIANVLIRYDAPLRALELIHRHRDATRHAAGGRGDDAPSAAAPSSGAGATPYAPIRVDAAATRADDERHADTDAAPDGMRLAAIEGLAHAALGDHAQVVRLLLPIERTLGGAFMHVLKRTGASVDNENAKRRRQEGGGGDLAGAVPLRGGGAAFATGDYEASGDTPLPGGDGDDSRPPSGESARARAVGAERMLGAPRRIRLAVVLACSLTALGRHSVACAVVVRLLDDMRTCGPERAEFYSVVSNDVVARLRLTCVRTAYACCEWDVAHDQLRALCLAHPMFGLNWALYNAMAGRARSRGYDERWLVRLLIREPSSPMVAVGVAHHFFLSRSFKIALDEYTRLFECFPTEPLLLLCLAVAQMQMVMSRANRDRGQSILLAFGWFGAYAELADEQAAAYNTARAYQHLGLVHLAASGYERALDIGRRRAAAAAAEMGPPQEPAHNNARSAAARDLSREAAHNLTRAFCASGNKKLARCVLRSMPVV